MPTESAYYILSVELDPRILNKGILRGALQTRSLKLLDDLNHYMFVPVSVIFQSKEN